MVIIDYKKKYHKEIIASVARALKQGKVVACPTDTSYGLAVDATNIRAIKKLYKVKGRDFNKPVHVVVPSVAYAKKIAQWNNQANQLASKFWPGALTLVIGLRTKRLGLRRISAGSGYIGLRIPDNQITADLSKALKKPITATSANVAGQPDNYGVEGIVAQFKSKKDKPDIIIDAGRLPKTKPSTVVKIFNNLWEILRAGPISKKQIGEMTKMTKTTNIKKIALRLN